ncbi:MAG: glycosyltransferase [Anaerolineaceae bacterium]|nr:glycosyltransferase [Anaerolineaceae bacterium]
MKIISFVEGANPKYGGMGIPSAPRIAKSLSKRGHDLRVVIGGTINPGYEKYRIPLSARQYPLRISGGFFGILDFPSIGRWSFSPAILNSLRKELQGTDFILLHSLYSFPVLAGYWLAKKAHIPYGLWLHGVLAPFQRKVGRRKKLVYDYLFVRSILNQASILFFTAPGEQHETEDLNLFPPSTIIPLGFDPNNIQGHKGCFREKYLGGSKADFILFLARINAKKGLELLLSAFQQALLEKPDLILVIAGGDDPLEYGNKIRRMAEHKGISKSVIFTGLLLGQDKANAFADASIYVLPSHAENFGFSVFEAMATGLPVVVSNSINYAQLIEQEGAGAALALDPRLFAEEILKLLADPDKRSTMGEKGKALAARFTWPKCAQNLENAIQRVLNKEAVPPNYNALF